MSNRKFFKDLTPGELQYLRSNAAAIGLSDPTILLRRDDGTTKFDEYLSPQQRDNLFNLLDRPSVRETTIRFDQAWNNVPTLDRGNLTNADLNIKPTDGVFTTPTVLTADQARARGIAGYDAVAEIVAPRPPVASVEVTAAIQQSGDYFRLTQKQTTAEQIAAETVIRDRNGGAPVVAVRTDSATGVVTLTDNKGDRYVLNRDEQEVFVKQRQTQFAVVEQEENELRYFRSWAEERGVSQSDIDVAFNSKVLNPDTNTLQLPTTTNTDFQNHLAEYKAANGRLPFATPATDLEQAGIVSQQTRIAEADSRSRPPGSGAGDKLESTNSVDTAVKLTETERARLAANDANDTLKREIITNGTPPVVAPSKAAASQSAVVEVTADSSVAANSVQVDGSGTTKTTTGSSSSAGNNTAAIQNNPLDEYESYTYGIALHVLKKDEYDRLAQNSKQWTPQHTLIASAGRWNESGDPNNSNYTGGDFKRAKGWEDNFYFDNLKMTQLQSPSIIGRGTNTLDMEFTIIEPYGLTLLDRMIRTANDLKQSSYMHLCYMLQIDFFDSQKGLLIDHRKYIPIQLIGMNIKVSGKGSQYVVNAAPFHHKALMNTITTTPQHMDVMSGTLREVFADTNASSESAGGEAAEERQRELQQINAPTNTSSYTGSGNANGTRVATAGGNPSDKVYQVNSYVAMYNGWWKKMKLLNATDPQWEPQNIKVRFADEIIKFEKLTKPTNVVAQGPMARSDAKQGVAVAESTKYEGFHFKAGSNIIEVINTVMLSSEYIRRQVLVANKNESKTGPILNTVDWWKVLPQVKLNGFDNVLNRWSYSITYFVVPYKVWNTKHPNLPKQSPVRANCVKQYNYLYTGDNRSVIDFQVEFDMLYFTTVAGLKQIEIDNPNRKESGGPDGAEQTNPQLTSDSRGAASNTITPVTHNLIPHDARNAGNNLQQDPIAVALGTIQDSIYSGPNGEMLTVNMKIIGDPTLVKQDDLFINIGEYYDPNGRSQSSDGIKLNSSNLKDASLNNNSIITDAGEVLAWVQVLVPPDIDENTGGLRLGASASSVNSFTGVYKIMEVQNEFSQGKFVQTLILIRYQEQEADKAYRDALAAESQRTAGAGSNDQSNLARSSDTVADAVSSVVLVDQSSQVATSSGGTTEEPTIPQPTSVNQPPTQLALLDAGNFPESVIEQTDLA